MVSAGRYTRKGAGRRWLVVGMVVTVLVLFVDASVRSRSPAPAQALASQVWMDRAVPLIQASDVEGKDLAGFRSATSTVAAGVVGADLTSMLTQTASTETALSRLVAPPSLQAAAGLLSACLMVRAQATAAIVSAVRSELSGSGGSGSAGTSSAVAATVAAAVRRLQVADSAYSLFAHALPASLRAAAPPSQWIPDPTIYTTSSLTTWLSGLQSRVHLSPIHQVAIDAVSTTPSAVAVNGSIEVLSPSSTLRVAAVIGDTGNQPEPGLTVTASISPSAGSSSATANVSLLAGQSTTVDLGPLRPPLGRTVTLTVTVSGPRGSSLTTQTTTVSFEMPSATSSTATTTVPAGSSTTTTGSASTSTTTSKASPTTT